MKTPILVTGLIALAFGILIFYRIIMSGRKNRKHNKESFAAIRPLHDKLAGGQAVSPEEVRPYALNLPTRELTFQLLADHGKTDLFPPELYTIVKAAEGKLAQWLMHPAELDACPDEMEYVKRVTICMDKENKPAHYEVFRYRVNKPHWAAENGWMLGVAGPYFDNSEPYDFLPATFSRIDSIADKVSPEEEAQWVHENIYLR